MIKYKINKMSINQISTRKTFYLQLMMNKLYNINQNKNNKSKNRIKNNMNKSLIKNKISRKINFHNLINMTKQFKIKNK